MSRTSQVALSIPSSRFNIANSSFSVLLVAASWVGGCTVGSLASNTGPRPPGQSWSDARHQMVHVGETVRFDFVLVDHAGRFVHPLGLADYCVMMIGPERKDAKPDLGGHFQFTHRFDDVPTGSEIEVRASAYRQHGGRDFMKMSGRWLQNDNPFDQPDQKVAGDAILLRVYETSLELILARPADELDMESGVLRVHRTDGAETSVYIDRPHRPGFRIFGPEPDGSYRIRYQPAGSELNPVGTTEVEFVIYDVAGRSYRVASTFATP